MNHKYFFLFACIPIRILFVIIAKYLPLKYYPYASILSLFPAFGFLIQYFGDFRKHGAFGQKIWWKQQRIIHSILYFVFSYMTYTYNRRAYIVLLLDVCFGCISFINHNLNLYLDINL